MAPTPGEAPITTSRWPLFVVFEGIDGSGTTTQARLLARRLRALQRPAVLTREPGGTAMGERIRRLLLDPGSSMDDTTEMLLYAASRAEHMAKLIRPALAAGSMVISDRYLDSSLAYQGIGRGLGVAAVLAANGPATAGCPPDLVVYLHVPVEEGARRRAGRAAPPDRLEAAGQLLQERVAGAYHQLAAANPATALELDGRGTPAALHDLVWERIVALCPELGEGPAPSFQHPQEAPR